MTKKEYMKPTLKVFKIEKRCRILARSDNYGLSRQLQNEEEVDEGY